MRQRHVSAPISANSYPKSADALSSSVPKYLTEIFSLMVGRSVRKLNGLSAYTETHCGL